MRTHGDTQDARGSALCVLCDCLTRSSFLAPSLRAPGQCLSLSHTHFRTCTLRACFSFPLLSSDLSRTRRCCAHLFGIGRRVGLSRQWGRGACVCACARRRTGRAGCCSGRVGGFERAWFLDGHSLHRAYAAHHDLTPPAPAMQHDARGSAVGPSCSSACPSLGVRGGSIGYDVQSREGVAVSPSSRVSFRGC
jgi:hypothetical protein